jgi:3alpha(or 20beta)-hydroxysteroid dehydrogenase
MFSLKDKVTVITGGGSGIGLATAKRFAEAGAIVVIANRSDSSALARSFGGRYVRTDVSKEDQVKALMDGVAKEHGRIDVLVNSAAVLLANMILETSAETASTLLAVNTLGVLYAIQHATPHMKNGGSIVNVSSLGGFVGFPGQGLYSATKAAVTNLTKSAAVELAPLRIRVNCVCPGTIDTPMMSYPGWESEVAFVGTATAIGRVGKPEEIAAAIHFLAADDCSYITGESIIIDGGLYGCYPLSLVETVVAAKTGKQS